MSEPMVVLLTEREKDVLDAFMRDGATNLVIARRLFVSVDTVKSHMKAIYRKTGAGDRTQLFAMVERGMVRIEDAPEMRGGRNLPPPPRLELLSTPRAGLQGPRLDRRYAALARQ